MEPETELEALRERVFGEEACYSVADVQRLEELERQVERGEAISQ